MLEMQMPRNISPEQNILQLIQSMLLIDPAKDAELQKGIRSKLGLSKLKLKLFSATISVVQLLFVTQVISGTKQQVPYTVLTKSNGNKETYRFKNNQAVSDFYSKMLSWGAIAEMAFGCLEPTAEHKDKKLLWTSMTKAQVYKGTAVNPTDFYSKVHECMRLSLDKTAETLSNNLLLISIGCGDGQEFEELLKLSQHKDKTIHIAGFDINSENIERAKRKFPQGNFIQGEIENLTAHVMTLQNLCKARCAEPFSTVILFSGILQRSILSGTYEGCRYLQNAYHRADVVLSGGILLPVISANMAKRIGFNTELQNVDYLLPNQMHKNVLYKLVPQSNQQRLAYIIKQSNKRSATKSEDNIDLMLSADPIKDLALIPPERLKKTIQVDLSWSQLNQSQLPSLITILRDQMPGLKVIMIADVEPWRAEFRALLITKWSLLICKRGDNINPLEVPHLTVSASRYLNFFDNNKMPYQVLESVKPKVVEKEVTPSGP